MKNYKMSKDLKELIIYIVLLLTAPAVLIAILDFLDKKEILYIFHYIDPLIFLIIFPILILISPAMVTVLAIKKAKGKYLRTFFNDLKYSTTGIVFIILVLISKHFLKLVNYT